jgi:L-cystine transport system permease protein
MLNMDFMRETFILVLKGIPVTLQLTAVVLLISIPLGFLVAIIRKKGHGFWAKFFGVYISFARGVPIMVFIYLIYTAIPNIVAKWAMETGKNFDIYGISGMAYAYFIFSFCMIPIMSEGFRAGLNAIDKGQLEAAKSVGIPSVWAYIRIVIPQAIVYTLPTLCNNVTSLVKMTSLAFSVSVFEITGIAKTEGSRHTSYVEAYLIIAVVYIVLNLLIELIFKIIEKRVSVYHKL